MGCVDCLAVAARPLAIVRVDRALPAAAQGALSMQPEDLQLLVTRTMPFGKYKGRLIADLPGNYLNWFARRSSAW